MTHPGLLSTKTLVMAALLGLSAPLALAQQPGDEAKADPNARNRAERVAASLVAGIPCTATGTADALERRLMESVAPLVDLAAGLDIVSASTDNCAEIRAAAARQRLHIAQSSLSGTDTVPAASFGTSSLLAFADEPPPLNLLRERGGRR